MSFKSGRQAFRARFFGHLRQRFQYLFFRVVDVADGLFKKFIERLHGLPPDTAVEANHRLDEMFPLGKVF
jgi:hypothetical protein